MNLLLYSMIVALLWGISPILLKSVMNKIDIKLVFILNSLFFIIGVIGYTIYYWNDIKISSKMISVNDIFLLALAAIVFSFIGNVIYFNLLNNYDSYIVLALVSSSPIFTLFISYVVYQENITTTTIVGILLVIIGIACLSYKKNQVTQTPSV